MKYVKRMLLALSIVAIAGGCTGTIFVTHHHPHKKVPPGHAKKMTGSQSAKEYAPGQRKKD